MAEVPIVPWVMASDTTELKTISAMGKEMMRNTDEKEGSSALSKSARSDFLGKTSTLAPMILPKSGPVRSVKGSPITTTSPITHQRSAPSISATATGPGVGGIKEGVSAKPESEVTA